MFLEDYEKMSCRSKGGKKRHHLGPRYVVRTSDRYNYKKLFENRNYTYLECCLLYFCLHPCDYNLCVMFWVLRIILSTSKQDSWYMRYVVFIYISNHIL